MTNENDTLLALAEADKAAILAELSRDRSPQAAQTVLERVLDRAVMRYCERWTDDESRREAQLLTRAVKSALPLMDCVGEVRRWDRAAGGQPARRVKPLALGLLIASGVLELAVLLGLMLAGGRLSGPIVFIEALIPAALAVGAAFWAGLQAGKPEKRPEAADTRVEFLIDPEKAWHALRGTLLIADDALARARAEVAARKQAETAAAVALDKGEAELFANLLESAYAQDNADAREMIEAMRFYLHGAGVEALDYAPGLESRFEFLPADRPGTLRPALVCGEKTVKKGLAAR